MKNLSIALKQLRDKKESVRRNLHSISTVP